LDHLTNNNNTAYSTLPAAAMFGVRATTTQTGSKYYFQMIDDVVDGIDHWVGGISDNTASLLTGGFVNSSFSSQTAPSISTCLRSRAR
jgi:hypothetical protein